MPILSAYRQLRHLIVLLLMHFLELEMGQHVEQFFTLHVTCRLSSINCFEHCRIIVIYLLLPLVVFAPAQLVRRTLSLAKTHLPQGHHSQNIKVTQFGGGNNSLIFTFAILRTSFYQRHTPKNGFCKSM